jgi:predicted ATP-grasp superfamily ATP-dependent carboligase
MQFNNRRDQKPHAIVIGLDNMAGLQAARILAGHKIPVIAIANNAAHYNCRTRVCERIIYADTSGDELIRVLEEIGKLLPQKAVLVPSEDWNVLNVSRHRDKLAKLFHYVLPDQKVVELVFNKADFYKFAQEHGLPIANTMILETRVDAEKAASTLNFPCILKPAGRTAEWEMNSPEKGYKVLNGSELLSVYDLYHNWAKSLIVQEWIDGPDSNLWSCYCYFDSDSRPLVTFTARKLRQWPPENGMSCLGVESRNDIVLEQALRLFTILRLHGIGHLEMKCDARTGKYSIIEAHVVRPTGRSPIAEAGGVELLYTMYCDALGWSLPSDLEQKYTGAKWIHLRRDFQSAFYYWRRGELTLVEWIQSLRGINAHAVFSWTDPGPFIADLIRAFRLLLSRGWGNSI